MNAPARRAITPGVIRAMRNRVRHHSLAPALDEIRALADSLGPGLCEDLHAVADVVARVAYPCAVCANVLTDDDWGRDGRDLDAPVVCEHCKRARELDL